MRTLLADTTPRGRTSTGRAVGACGACGTGIATEGVEAGESGTCPHCGARVRMRFVYGERSEQPCDGRCMGAVGPWCSCACGGANHGRSNLRINLVPVFDQDAARAAQTRRRSDHAARVERKRVTAAEKIAAARADLLARYPALAVLADYDPADLGRFLWDMRDAFLRGQMSPRQAATAADAITRQVKRDQEHADRRAQWQARDAALTAAGVRVPTGRVEFTGEIVAIHDDKINQFSYHAPIKWEMTVSTVDGWRVRGVIPATLMADAMRDGGKPSDLRGRVVTVRARTAPGKRSPLFGYFSNPRIVATPTSLPSTPQTPAQPVPTVPTVTPTPAQFVSGWASLTA